MAVREGELSSDLCARRAGRRWRRRWWLATRAWATGPCGGVKHVDLGKRRVGNARLRSFGFGAAGVVQRRYPLVVFLRQHPRLKVYCRAYRTNRSWERVALL